MQKLAPLSTKTSTSYLYGNFKNHPMTYAIIETGGKQLRVEAGRFYDVELLSVQPDQTITLESVLLVQHNGDVTIGQPFINGATVEGTVMRHLRGRKVLVYKMKPKKKTRKKRGHRQEITRLMINSISLNGSVLTKQEAAADEAQQPGATLVSDEPAPESGGETAAEVAEQVAAGETAAEVAEQVVADETAAQVASEVAAQSGGETAAEVAEQVVADETAAQVAAEVAQTAGEPADEQQ